MSPIADDSYLADQLYELEAEREYMAEYVEHRKPYWLTLRHPRDGEMQWDLWNYAPLAHYDRAIDETREQLDDAVRTDGGYSDLHRGTTRAACPGRLGAIRPARRKSRRRPPMRSLDSVGRPRCIAYLFLMVAWYG